MYCFPSLNIGHSMSLAIMFRLAKNSFRLININIKKRILILMLTSVGSPYVKLFFVANNVRLGLIAYKTRNLKFKSRV